MTSNQVNKLFAWQGLSLMIPCAWNLANFEGDRRRGYVRLDEDGETRLEMRWQRSTAEPVAEFRDVADKYATRLVRAARRKRRQLEIQRKIDFALAGEDSELMEGLGENHFFMMLARCRDCYCTTSVILHTAKRNPHFARDIFSTFNDHPAANSGDHWSIYGVEFESPIGAELAKAELFAGGVGIILSRKREEWEAARWGPASVALKHLPLSEWVSARFEKKLRGVQGAAAKALYRGHEAVEFNGSRLKRLSLFDLLPSQFRVRLRAWHCERDDKIHVCRWITRAREDAEFDKFCESLRCH